MRTLARSHGMSADGNSTPRADPHLIRIFWTTYTGQEIAGQAASETDIDAVRDIASLPQADEALVRQVAQFCRECAAPLGEIAFFLRAPNRLPIGSVAADEPWPRVNAAYALWAGRNRLRDNDLRRAEVYLLWAMRGYEASGENVDSMRHAYIAAGQIYQLTGRLREASECFLAAYEADLASGNRFNQGTDLGLLAEVARLARQYDGAERLARQALTIHDQFGNALSAAGILVTLGLVEKARGHRWRARWYLWRARRAVGNMRQTVR